MEFAVIGVGPATLTGNNPLKPWGQDAEVLSGFPGAEKEAEAAGRGAGDGVFVQGLGEFCFPSGAGIYLSRGGAVRFWFRGGCFAAWGVFFLGVRGFGWCFDGGDDGGEVIVMLMCVLIMMIIVVCLMIVMIEMTMVILQRYSIIQ